MKKNQRKIITIAVVVLTLTVATAAVWANTYEPGSQDDPVVTKSYVDGKISELKSAISVGNGEMPSFTAVKIPAGKKLIGGEGAEFILRSGEAKAIDNGIDGVSDITGGSDLKTGQDIARNHLLLIPRDDGRGIAASNELWVMIRGTYFIQ
ncbi:MAG: hypothetical protein ACOX4U_01280 [Anaerovoracaceae bacterium]|jgi:hypothetical protein